MNEIVILHGFLSRYQSGLKAKSLLHIIVKYEYQTYVPNAQRFFLILFLPYVLLNYLPVLFLAFYFLELFQGICK